MGWDNDQWGGMHGWNGEHGYYGVGMGIFFLILLAVAIWAIVRVTRRDKSSISSTSNSVVSSASHKETPREILDRRFANVEINADEYKNAKDLLSQ